MRRSSSVTRCEEVMCRETCWRTRKRGEEAKEKREEARSEGRRTQEVASAGGTRAAAGLLSLRACLRGFSLSRGSSLSRGFSLAGACLSRAGLPSLLLPRFASLRFASLSHLVAELADLVHALADDLAVGPYPLLLGGEGVHLCCVYTVHTGGREDRCTSEAKHSTEGTEQGVSQQS